MKNRGKHFWQLEEHKHESYHFRKRRNRLHFTVFYCVVVFLLLVLSLALEFPYSQYVLLVTIFLSIGFLGWVLRILKKRGKV